ncbi:glycosyltransferase [Candidatus Woesearchaeota archaeon]|nr:glycosyltransferase [Candidatus Woesearchaeota archaeon]
MKNIILPDTSLAAIMRDEIMNPAGGIVDFVESTVPFVEKAVIVDTGSIDGTREALEELEAKHDNLTIYDLKFEDYAQSRNYGLSKLKTKRALVLDADERLVREDFEQLNKLIEEHPNEKMKFRYLVITPDESREEVGPNPRLFPVLDRLRYVNTVTRHFEWLYENNDMIPRSNMLKTGIQIKHFVPDKEGIQCKDREWYGRVMFDGVKKAPSEIPSFHKWKQFNQKREEYR